MKENVVELTGVLDKIELMRGVSYNRIGHTRREIGVIAQEVNAYFPEIVDSTGSPINPYWGVNYDRLGPILLEAVKELNAKVVAQQLQIETLQLAGLQPAAQKIK